LLHSARLPAQIAAVAVTANPQALCAQYFHAVLTTIRVRRHAGVDIKLAFN
jgi:hypothetical protein